MSMWSVPEPGQRVGQEVLHRLGTVVVPAELVARPAQHAELDAQRVAVPIPAAQRLGEQQLVVAHGVEVAGVDQRDAGVQRGVHGGDALRAVGRAVRARHAHRAQAQRGNGRAGAAQGSCLHRVLLRRRSATHRAPAAGSRGRGAFIVGAPLPGLAPAPRGAWRSCSVTSSPTSCAAAGRRSARPRSASPTAPAAAPRACAGKRWPCSPACRSTTSSASSRARSSQPSTQLLGALARALRLSDDERDHLFHLAGHQPPPADGVARLARAGLVRMLDLLGDTPAMVLSDLGEVLAQNRAAVLLTGDHTGFTGDRRYVAYRWFTDPAARGRPPARGAGAPRPPARGRPARGSRPPVRRPHGRRTRRPAAGRERRVPPALGRARGGGPSRRPQDPACTRGWARC